MFILQLSHHTLIKLKFYLEKEILSRKRQIKGECVARNGLVRKGNK